MTNCNFFCEFPEEDTHENLNIFNSFRKVFVFKKQISIIVSVHTDY